MKINELLMFLEARASPKRRKTDESPTRSPAGDSNVLTQKYLQLCMKINDLVDVLRGI